MPGNGMVAATEETLTIDLPRRGTAGTHRAQTVLQAERDTEDVHVAHPADVGGVDIDHE